MRFLKLHLRWVITLRGGILKKQELEGSYNYLFRYLISSLDELKELRMNAPEKRDDEFLLGETYAFLECLEIILLSTDTERAVMLGFEKKYGII